MTWGVFFSSFFSLFFPFFLYIRWLYSKKKRRAARLLRLVIITI